MGGKPSRGFQRALGSLAAKKICGSIKNSEEKASQSTIFASVSGHFRSSKLTKREADLFAFSGDRG